VALYGRDKGGERQPQGIPSKQRSSGPARTLATAEFADPKILSPRQSAILTKDPHPRPQLKRYWIRCQSAFALNRSIL